MPLDTPGIPGFLDTKKVVVLATLQADGAPSRRQSMREAPFAA
jgi:hypothetical protein